MYVFPDIDKQTYPLWLRLYPKNKHKEEWKPDFLFWYGLRKG